jgi:RNA recognition motif-containing protein
MSGNRTKGRQIFIGNLPFSVTKTQLKEAFKDFGSIQNAEIFYDEKGRSKGCGVVLFERK